MEGAYLRYQLLSLVDGHPTRMKRQYWPVLPIGFVVGLLPYIADRMHSGFYPGALEYVWVPGLLLAAVIFPEGVHTGSGTSMYVPLAIVLNVVFYCFVTWASIRYFERRKKNAHLC